MKFIVREASGYAAIGPGCWESRWVWWFYFQKQAGERWTEVSYEDWSEIRNTQLLLYKQTNSMSSYLTKCGHSYRAIGRGLRAPGARLRDMALEFWGIKMSSRSGMRSLCWVLVRVRAVRHATALLRRDKWSTNKYELTKEIRKTTKKTSNTPQPTT